METNEEMTAGQIAKEIGRHRKTAWGLLRNGRIKNARRVGRWLWVAPKKDVLDFMRARDRDQAA